MSDSWTLAQWEGEDGLYLVRTRDRPADEGERAAFPIAIRIFWGYDDADGDDLPDDATFDRMEAFENALHRASEAGGWAVGVAAITGGGAKEWLYYAADADAFAQGLNAALESHPEYPLTFEFGPDPDWTTFGELTPKATLH